MSEPVVVPEMHQNILHA